MLAQTLKHSGPKNKHIECQDAKETVKHILRHGGDGQLRIIFILSNWWHERNSIREGGLRRSADHIACLSGRQASEIKALNSSALEGNCRPLRRWERSPPGTLKLNVDGSFREAEVSSGWGYVIRDTGGSVIKTGSGRINHAYGPLQMEPVACVKGVSAAMALGISDIVLV